ncbi:uncharacterized protein TNCV_1993981 [Trichonephila clavipes]|nr:uncharacterized protein TNCV_1993981 [Trichonephila clavipes]
MMRRPQDRDHSLLDCGCLIVCHPSQEETFTCRLVSKECFFPGIEVQVGITFQDGDRFNSCQVIYSQFGLAIHQNDHQARRRFVEWAQNEIAVVPDFHKRILFSDEAHFWLNGYVNKQNGGIWNEANPQVALVTNFFIPELNNHDIQELWFQQDGATCHTARATIDLLKDTLGDRLISRFGPVNWPPRSCDLTPLDYFLWGYVKSLVYADKPQTLNHLEDNIRCVIADIRPQMLNKVIENWTSRLDYIRASRGNPMPEIIFKILGHRSLPPTDPGRVEEEMACPGGRPLQINITYNTGPVNWLPRSCDLTPLDSFLWGYVKSLVYADKAQTLDHLEDNIRRVIADIPPQMLEKVIENWTSRLDYIRARRDSPMPEITFKM